VEIGDKWGHDSRATNLAAEAGSTWFFNIDGITAGDETLDRLRFFFRNYDYLDENPPRRYGMVNWYIVDRRSRRTPAESSYNDRARDSQFENASAETQDSD